MRAYAPQPAHAAVYELEERRRQSVKRLSAQLSVWLQLRRSAAPRRAFNWWSHSEHTNIRAAIRLAETILAAALCTLRGDRDDGGNRGSRGDSDGSSDGNGGSGGNGGNDGNDGNCKSVQCYCCCALP